jgi:hypothetical protein
MATYELPINSPLTETGDDVYAKPLDSSFTGAAPWINGTISATEVADTNVYIATLDEEDGYIVYLNGLSNVFTADDSQDQIVDAAHGLLAGEVVRFKGLDLPGGLSQSTLYYVIDVITDRFRVSLTAGGVAVNLTDAGTGTMVYVATSQRSKANDVVLGTIPIVNAGELTPEGEAALIAALKADADFGTAGLLLDAKRARQFDSNRRTHETLGATQIRYTVYEDDAVTVAYVVDFNPLTGAKAVVT